MCVSVKSLLNPGSCLQSANTKCQRGFSGTWSCCWWPAVKQTAAFIYAKCFLDGRLLWFVIELKLQNSCIQIRINADTGLAWFSLLVFHAEQGFLRELIRSSRLLTVKAVVSFFFIFPPHIFKRLNPIFPLQVGFCMSLSPNADPEVTTTNEECPVRFFFSIPIIKSKPMRKDSELS